MFEWKLATTLLLTSVLAAGAWAEETPTFIGKDCVSLPSAGWRLSKVRPVNRGQAKTMKKRLVKSLF